MVHTGQLSMPGGQLKNSAITGVVVRERHVKFHVAKWCKFICTLVRWYMAYARAQRCTCVTTCEKGNSGCHRIVPATGCRPQPSMQGGSRAAAATRTGSAWR